MFDRKIKTPDAVVLINELFQVEAETSGVFMIIQWNSYLLLEKS